MEFDEKSNCFKNIAIGFGTKKNSGALNDFVDKIVELSILEEGQFSLFSNFDLFFEQLES